MLVLLSMNKLEKDIHAMRLFSLLLPKENREQLKGLSTQVSEIDKAIDDYIGFYSVNTEAKAFISNIEEQISINGSKLKQVASEIQESKTEPT